MSDLADLVILLAGALVFLGILCCVVRLVIGPSIVDRIVAIDMLTIIAISMIGLYAQVAGRTAYLDVALVYGLLSFLSVLAIARFLDRGL